MFISSFISDGVYMCLSTTHPCCDLLLPKIQPKKINPQTHTLVDIAENKREGTDESRNGTESIGARAKLKNRLKQIVRYFQLPLNTRISLFLFIGMLVIVRSKVLLNAHHVARCV